MQQLIEMGKCKGFLTYEEVNDALPPDVVAADQMDDVMGALGDEDIEIVDAATQVEIAQAHRRGRGAREEARADREDERRGRRGTTQVERPVRMYLRKMGSVSLLTREGEVEIAKRIEDGEHSILGAILEQAPSPSAR